MEFAWLAILSVGLFDITRSDTLLNNNDQWYRFATSHSYENYILVLDSYNPFKPYHISKAKPPLWARMECAKACSSEVRCEAFNFYETNGFYVCQRLPDNFCQRKGRLALQVWPGGAVWDKLSPAMSKSCIGQKLEVQSGRELCGTLRSGCQGTWPDCNDCVKSCYDCRRNSSNTLSGFFDCTLWPEGWFSSPIFGQCVGDATYIIKRAVDATTGYETTRYVMSFWDMERLSRLRHYTTVEFWFSNSNERYLTSYKFSSIDSSGRLSNVSLNSGVVDGFNLQGQTLSLAYVNVTVADDIYSCGSFWLLDKNNATYCPGGKVSVFGTPKNTGSSVITGIRWPQTNSTIVYTDVKLAL